MNGHAAPDPARTESEARDAPEDIALEVTSGVFSDQQSYANSIAGHFQGRCVLYMQLQQAFAPTGQYVGDRARLNIQ